MLIEHRPDFLKRLRKIRDNRLKQRVKKQVERIIDCPDNGKPMRYGRKGTREVRVAPYRLAYAYLPEEGRLVFLELYHKDEQ